MDPRPPTVLRMWRRSTEETALHMATGEGGQRPPMFNPRTARRKDRSCGLIHEKYWIHCIVLRPPYSSNKVSPVLRYCATGVESPDMADMGQKQCPHTYFTLTHCTDHFREPLNVLKHASAHSTPLRHSRVTFKPEKTPRGKPEASIPASRTTHLRHRLHGKGVKNLDKHLTRHDVDPSPHQSLPVQTGVVCPGKLQVEVHPTRRSLSDDLVNVPQRGGTGRRPRHPQRQARPVVSDSAAFRPHLRPRGRALRPGIIRAVLISRGVRGRFWL